MQKYVTFFHHEIFFVQKYQNEKKRPYFTLERVQKLTENILKYLCYNPYPRSRYKNNTVVSSFDMIIFSNVI